MKKKVILCFEFLWYEWFVRGNIDEVYKLFEIWFFFAFSYIFCFFSFFLFLTRRVFTWSKNGQFFYLISNFWHRRNSFKLSFETTTNFLKFCYIFYRYFLIFWYWSQILGTCRCCNKNRGSYNLFHVWFKINFFINVLKRKFWDLLKLRS